jgi:hypothetical protein
MKISPSPMTALDYCNAYDRGEVVVNRQYQRSDKVWPDVARSYLIETVLKGYPIPKLWLHQKVDRGSRKAVKEIVDGQQRSTALWDFYNNRLRLSEKLELLEAAGKTYEELESDLQDEFDNYSLTFDLFVNTTDDEVREVFRRMNSYTIPLNPEEHRHAVWQGECKWFINSLSREYSGALLGMHVLTEKQLVRMGDSKLLTEITDALLHGIRTTRRTTLDNLYKENDKEFPEEQELRERLTRAFDRLLSWTEIHDSSLMKPYQVYSLVLAIAHLERAVPTLEADFASPGGIQLEDSEIERNLFLLADALDNPEEAEDLLGFVEASSSRTNVAEQRKKRFVWFCKALTDQL